MLLALRSQPAFRGVAAALMPFSNRRLSTEPPTVLIVDDDFDARQMYSEYLHSKGWAAFTAADGRGGIDKATDLLPSAIVLDLTMPRVDGWTALKQLRESSWTSAIPVIIVSAMTEARDQAFLAGCDAFLAKPCTPDVLWLQIRALLRLQTSARDVRV
jgi:DNA-binding response OmpR family regulator